jgi:TupA-like ATPgrasp
LRSDVRPFAGLQYRQSPVKNRLQSALFPVSQALPNIWVCNYLVAAAYFVKANGRFPRKRNASNATINDFIFHRMIDNRWSLLQQLCVDKQYAKIFAARAADVNVARTIAVFSLEYNPSPEDFAAWISPHIGRRAVAKSTHGFGTTLFLDRNVTESDVYGLFVDANRNFFYAARETLYKSLERKILIEENVAATGDVNDYKFFCVKGNVIYCQVDVDRFVNHKRALFTVPEFKMLSVKMGLLENPDQVQRPAQFKEMVRVASDLSRDFDFVRIDLYAVDGRIYFGGYSFTPGAACDHFSDENFAIEFQRTVGSLLRNRASDGALA